MKTRYCPIPCKIRALNNAMNKILYKNLYYYRTYDTTK